MKPRQFIPISVAIAGDQSHRRRVYRFRCATPGCDATHEVSSNTHSGARALEDLTKTMTRAGWELGRNASRDFCPQCMADIRKRRRGADSRKGAEMAKDQEPSKTTAAATAAPEPRALGIDEALVIAEKLGEVYVGKDKGYSDGWSDKRLAEDLNVPRDWVRQIREKRFGPAGDSEEARALLAEARVASADAALMVRAVAEKLDRLDALKGQIATLANEAQTISADVDKRFRDQMAECSRTIGRVERSIANIEKVFV